MVPLLDINLDNEKCDEEIGQKVGQLLTPLTRFKLKDPNRLWAIDNGGFTKFNKKAFLGLLEREFHHKEKCLFVALPDVVGSAIRTLEIFDIWIDFIKDWKIALVCQDGQENFPIPWNKIDAVFIGGTTAWKLSDKAAQIVKAAKILEKHVHIGRINTPDRWKYFESLGADTVDGSGISQYSHMRQAISNRNSGGFFS